MARRSVFLVARPRHLSRATFLRMSRCHSESDTEMRYHRPGENCSIQNIHPSVWRDSKKSKRSVVRVVTAVTRRNRCSPSMHVALGRFPSHSNDTAHSRSALMASDCLQITHSSHLIAFYREIIKDRFITDAATAAMVHLLLPCSARLAALASFYRFSDRTSREYPAKHRGPLL